MDSQTTLSVITIVVTVLIVFLFLYRKSKRKKTIQKLRNTGFFGNEDGTAVKKDISFEVKGIKYRDDVSIQEALKIKRGDLLTFLPDPENKHDKYAVKILYNGTWIGFVERGLSEFTCAYLQYCSSYECKVSVVSKTYYYTELDKTSVNNLKSIFIFADAHFIFDYKEIEI